MKAGEEGSTLARRTARARRGEISGEHRSDTPRGPSVPWMAPSEIGLAPCEAYSPTYLAQALPDTIRLLRKRGAWEMNDHEDIAAQGERVRKILSLVKCLLTGEYPRPSTPERLLCFLSRAYWHPAASTHGTRALFARAAPHARGIAGPRRARFDPVPARPIDPRSTPGGRATRPRVTARGSPRALPPIHPVKKSPQPELRETLTDSSLPRPSNPNSQEGQVRQRAVRGCPRRIPRLHRRRAQPRGPTTPEHHPRPHRRRRLRAQVSLRVQVRVRRRERRAGGTTVRPLRSVPQVHRQVPVGRGQGAGALLRG